MKAIVCDRCGKVEHEGSATTIRYPYSDMDYPDEQHLCWMCARELREWMKEDA